MKDNMAKRIFTIALVVCLALLLILCANGKLLLKLSAEPNSVMQNESLYLERRGEGVIYIGGEGELYGPDMLALMEGDRDSVTDIILGDGITALGYGAIDGFDDLQTLYLGRGVKTAANASVRATEALKVAFIPRSLSRVGRDFLYGNESCLVITDGSVDELPKLKNVNKADILTGIDSYEALVAACEESVELPETVKLWWT